MSEQKLTIHDIPAEKLHVVDWNPNVQNDKTFNALVQNIEEIGFVEPLLVTPKEGAPGEFVIVGGAHRYEAGKLVGMTTFPCVIKDFDEDQVKFQNVRMNMLKGKLDPVKFTKLFDEMASKYGEELTKEMMAFTDERAFQELYVNVRDQLPKEMKEKLEKSKDEIKTVDDLSRILNEMFSKYGDTLAYDYMIFTYGGKSHYWIQMDADVKKKMEKIADLALSTGTSVNKIFSKIITSEIAEEVLNQMIASGEIEDMEEASNF